MIWIRRFAALFLAILFVPTFLLAILVLRVNDTFLSADFYVAELRKADPFNFLYNRLIPTALDEIEPSEVGGVTLDRRPLANRGAIALRSLFPPEWLQEQTELVIQQWLPYITGSTDEFSIRLPVADRLDTLGQVIIGELGEEGAYTLLFNDVVSPLADDKLGQGGDLPLGVVVRSQDVVDAVQPVFPRQWIQGNVEHVTGELVPYLAGERDTFAIAIPLEDRIQAAVPATKELLNGSNIYNVLSNPEFENEVEQQIQEFGDLPCNVQITGAQIVSLARQVIDRRWIQENVESNIDRAALYLTDPSQDTILALPLADRVQRALGGDDAPVKALLRDIGFYDMVYEECIVPQVVDIAAQAAGQPATADGSAEEMDAPAFSMDITETVSIVVTQGELRQALQDVLGAVSPEWIREQVEEAVDDVVPFVTGESEHFAVVLSVADVLEEVGPVIGQIVDQKLNDTYNAFPECTIQQAVDLAQTGLGGSVPICRPTGFSIQEVQQALGIPGPPLPRDTLEQFCFCDLSLILEGVTLDDLLDTLGLDVTGLVEEQLEQLLPSAYTFCDTETYLPTCDTGLRESLGPDDQETLDNALEWTRDGFTYTDAKLRDQFDDDQETLDRILGWTRNGLTYTDVDMRDDLGADGGERLDDLIRWNRDGFTEADLRDLITDNGADPAAFEDFDTIRSRFGLARSLRFLVYIEMGLSLAAIGALGGRRWPSRIAWAAAVLGTAALLVFIAAGPLYGTVIESLLDNQFDNIRADMVADGSGDTALLMMDKTLSVARTVATDFVSGVANRALLFLLLALAGLGLAIFWPWLFGRPRPPNEYGPEPPLDTPEETVATPASAQDDS